MMKSKKVIAIITASVMAFTMIMVPSYAQAGNQEKLDNLKDKIENAQEQMKENNEKAETIKGEMTDLESDIEKIQDEVYELEDEVRETQLKVEKAQKELKKSNEDLDARLRNMYKSGGMGFIDIILSSGNISDLFSNLAMVQYIFENDKNVVEQLEKDYEKLEEMKKNLEEKQEQLNSKQDELGASYDKLAAQKKSLNKENATLKEDIQQWQADSAAIEEAIKNAQNNGGGYHPPSGGVSSQGYMWPVPSSHSISSYYGWRSWGSYSEFHLGIDIPAGYGQDVVAAADGMVIATGGQHWSYGNIVIIDHGNGIATAYAHNSSIVVSTGQVVKKGQVIAKIGSTGNSTGNHCHFEVRINGSTVDPLGYVSP